MDAFPYDLPLAKPYVWAKGTQTRRRGVLVRARAGGFTGWGEVAPPPHEERDWAAEAATVVRATRHIDPLGDLRAVDRVVSEPRLRAGIVTAMLDVQAQAEGVPLHVVLARIGGFPARFVSAVDVNALIGAVDPTSAAAAATEAVAAGFTTLKIKCTGDDLARVTAVRDAAPDATLRLDANGAWDPAWAADHVRALAALDIAYVEDPIAGDADAWRELRAEVAVPLAADAPITGPTDLQDFQGAADVVVVKPQRVGGPDRAAHLLAFAKHLGFDVVVTNSLETAVGRAAAWHVAALTQLPAGLATEEWLAEDVGDFQARGGRIVAPPGNGLGIEVRHG